MNNEYIVEKILNKRIKYNKPEYLIKWEGYSDKESTWEPMNNLQNLLGLINDFEKTRKESHQDKVNGNTKQTKYRKF